MYDEWDDFNRFNADYLLEKSKEKVSEFSSMLQEIKVSQDLGREPLFELGRYGVYKRVLDFQPEGLVWTI